MNKQILLLALFPALLSAQSDRTNWFHDAKLGIEFPAPTDASALKAWADLGRKIGARYGIALTPLNLATAGTMPTLPAPLNFPLGLDVKIPEQQTGKALLATAQNLIDKNPNAALILLDISQEQSTALAPIWSGRNRGPLTGDRYWNRQASAGGDFYSFGPFLPSSPIRDPKGTQRPFESHYLAADFESQKPENLIRLLAEVASKGGNLVLDFAQLPSSTKAIDALSTWLRSNGESIYGSQSSPFDRMPFYGRATRKGDTLYLHIFQFPKDGKLTLTGLESQVLSAAYLAGGGTIAIARQGTETSLQLGPKPSETADLVVKLQLASPVRIKPYIISTGKTGAFEAGVAAAEFEARSGQMIRKELDGERVVLTNWKRAIDVPSWKVNINADGRYAVSVVYKAPPTSAGATYTVTMRGDTVGMTKGVIQASPDYKEFPVSNMELEAGNYILVIQPENKPGIEAMTFEKIILRRIGD